jgi:hypothetical protein
MARSVSRIQCQFFSLSKLGNTSEENEDAFAAQEILAGLSEFACALTDGATRASFSGLWARLLAAEAIARPLQPASLAGLLASAQAKWAAELAGLSLPWHAEEKVRQGAFATLAWIQLDLAPRIGKAGGGWQALAVGDSCIFQARKGDLIQQFPHLSSSDFKKDPLLFCSAPGRNGALLSQPASLTCQGDWLPGDEFYLLSDALAAWLVQARENGDAEPALADLRGHFLGRQEAGQESFTRWIQALRTSRQIKNDDTSAARLSLEAKTTPRRARP